MDIEDMRNFLSEMDRELLLDGASKVFVEKAYLQVILEEILENNDISLQEHQKEMLKKYGLI